MSSNGLRQLNMFEQCLPKRRGTAEPRMPHGTRGNMRGTASLFAVPRGYRDALVVTATGQQAKRLDRLAGRH